MIVNRHRQKLIEAINFFAANTRKCGKTKLFKLLYFLDFEHFKETGRSVTGLEYFAWPKGPVPLALFEEIEHPKDDLAAKVRFKQIPVKRHAATMLSVEATTGIDKSHFSKRELRIMGDLAKKYRETDADQMVEATHLENLPWHEVYEIQQNRQGLIPYDLALRKQDREEMLEHIAEIQEIQNNYKG